MANIDYTVNNVEITLDNSHVADGKITLVLQCKEVFAYGLKRARGSLLT